MTASLSDRFMRRLPETARRAVDCFAAEVPYYGMLPREVLDGEITEFTKQHFRIFARVNVAARVGIETLRELATPDEVDEVLAVSVQLQRYLQLMLPAVTAAYLEERQGVYGAAADARRDLFEALVKGMPWEEAAERASVTLALSYHVLFLYMPEPATNTVVARRRAHRAGHRRRVGARARAGRAGWSRRHHLAARGGQGGITAAVVLGGGRGSGHDRAVRGGRSRGDRRRCR